MAIAEYKKKIVNDIVKLTKDYSIIGLVNMEDLPAPQLQTMKKELRGKMNLFMTKKRLMKIALDKIKNEKKGAEELEKYFEGMPALLFTNESPFKLSKLLQKSKSKAPAKAGQTAPDDITINKGPTPFAPGPIISELSSVGLKVGVEGGKVAVKEDTVIVKKGEKIKPKVAEILTRLDIKPMEVGLGLVAAYEDGIIYQKDILKIDEAEFNNKLNSAAAQAFNLAFNITYTTKDNINLLISHAFNDAKALGVGQEILDEGIVENLLSKAENSMLSLKNTANIETAEQKVEEKKAEVPAKEKVEQEEKKILEEEKKIIEEEKKLEKEKPKEDPVEKEVQEAVKKEEEKKLESERIEKEKELEKVEERKSQPKPEEKPEPKKEIPKPETKELDIDIKVKQMVEKTKKFVTGTEETAADIIEDVKKEETLEEKKEEKIEEQKTEEDKTKVPTAHDLKEKKESQEEKEEKTENKERKEVEELTKELIKKGTLRDKK